MHVVITQEDHVGTNFGTPNKMGPFLNQGLPGLICWMGLSREDELHAALRIGEQPKQSLWVVQQ
jgi:hypothetical protein